VPNKFDKEMRDLRAAAPPERRGAVRSSLATNFMPDTNLSHLEEELKASDTAAHADVVCEQNEAAELAVSVKGQIVGVWKSDGSSLALYRPGAELPDCVASGVSEAAALTARLVAAVSQA
jgi:hypothetical protein